MIPCFNISILILSFNLRLGVSGRLFPLGIALVQPIHQVMSILRQNMTRFLNAQFRDEGESVRKCAEHRKKESGTEMPEKEMKIKM
jgi:hypothetical protein